MLDLEPIIDLARDAYEAETLERGEFHIVHTPTGIERINLTGDEWLDQPKRKKGTFTVTDVASFAKYWEKHSDANSEVYADRSTGRVTAVLNAHKNVEGEENGARFGDHRLVLQLQHSDSWRAWTGRNEKQMTQEDFAEFLEDHLGDVLSPSAAEMLEIVTSIQASLHGDFESKVALSNGQRQFKYMENVKATAGTAQRQLEIPTEIGLALRVFDGDERGVNVTARFRYRIGGGKLVLFYKLDRPNEIVQAAFEGAVVKVGEACGTTVLRGAPA